MVNSEFAVLKALIYSDLFSHPLTFSEVWRYTDGIKITKSECQEALQKLFPLVDEKSGYYFLREREHVVTNRKDGEPHAKEKMQLARAIAKLLGKIPTVYYIGLSGRVASGSASKEDDIDFFIITRKNTLFITRLLILSFLQLLGRRRQRTERIGKDKVCVNMLLDETVLTFPTKQRNLYIAREIAQMVPLFERNNTYQFFLSTNKWVKAFLPQSHAKTCPHSSAISPRVERVLLFFEYFAKQFQLRSITAHKTKEVVTDHLLAFHPRDYQRKTLRSYKQRVQEYARVVTQRRQASRIVANLDKAQNIFYTA